MDILFAIAGLVLLFFGGDILVKGAVALSLRLGLSTLLVGLTVVAFGTSAPELLVSIDAATGGTPSIAVGNVVGSNIANVLLVLGVPAIIHAIPISTCACHRSYVQMLLASILLVALCFAGPLSYWHGALLLAAFSYVMWDMVRDALANPGEIESEVGELAHRMGTIKMLTFLIGGLVALPVGAHLLIDGSIGIARTAGISEAAIGLTMVAIGTSLPELATTVVAALRREPGMAIGNAIGSNLFNILAILGITSFFAPIPIEPSFLDRDLWVMLASAGLLGYFIATKGVITRFWGVVFVALYVGYVAYLTVLMENCQ